MSDSEIRNQATNSLSGEELLMALEKAIERSKQLQAEDEAADARKYEAIRQEILRFLDGLASIIRREPRPFSRASELFLDARDGSASYVRTRMLTRTDLRPTRNGEFYYVIFHAGESNDPYLFCKSFREAKQYEPNCVIFFCDEWHLGAVFNGVPLISLGSVAEILGLQPQLYNLYAITQLREKIFGGVRLLTTKIEGNNSQMQKRLERLSASLEGGPEEQSVSSESPG